MANSPWSVKGIDPGTREAAKVAARRAGVPVGVWLTQVIRQAAVNQFKGVTATPAMAMPANDEPIGEPPPTPGRANVPAPTMHALFEGMQKLMARVERIEAGDRPTLSTAPIERAVMRISERLDRMEAGLTKSGNVAKRGLFGLWR